MRLVGSESHWSRLIKYECDMHVAECWHCSYLLCFFFFSPLPYPALISSSSGVRTRDQCPAICGPLLVEGVGQSDPVSPQLGGERCRCHRRSAQSGVDACFVFMMLVCHVCFCLQSDWIIINNLTAWLSAPCPCFVCTPLTPDFTSVDIGHTRQARPVPGPRRSTTRTQCPTTRPTTESAPRRPQGTSTQDKVGPHPVSISCSRFKIL